MGHLKTLKEQWMVAFQDRRGSIRKKRSPLFQRTFSCSPVFSYPPLDGIFMPKAVYMGKGNVIIHRGLVDNSDGPSLFKRILIAARGGQP
jgi:hypothetical protein